MPEFLIRAALCQLSGAKKRGKIIVRLQAARRHCMTKDNYLAHAIEQTNSKPAYDAACKKFWPASQFWHGS